MELFGGELLPGETQQAVPQVPDLGRGLETPPPDQVHVQLGVLTQFV